MSSFHCVLTRENIEEFESKSVDSSLRQVRVAKHNSRSIALRFGFIEFLLVLIERQCHTGGSSAMRTATSCTAHLKQRRVIFFSNEMFKRTRPANPNPLKTKLRSWLSVHGSVSPSIFNSTCDGSKLQPAGGRSRRRYSPRSYTGII